MLRLATVTVIAGVVWCAPVQADPALSLGLERPDSEVAAPPPDDGTPPPMELGAFVGGWASSADHQFYDLPKLRGMMRPELSSVAPQFGVRFAYFPAKYFGGEVEASLAAEQTQGTSSGVTILHYGVQAIGQYPVAKGKFIPFVAAGWGIWDSQSSALGNSVHFPIHFGLGARFYLTNAIAVRADVRLYRGPSNGPPYTYAASYGEFNLGFTWAPKHKPKPPEPERIDPDTDGDGIRDSLDKCPTEPEDKDMFQDQDGCPDPDNDGDGIPDANDKCPLDPEDFDGFQDADGCPDNDNDGDGIPDKSDICPNEPEDKDGYKDLDGCPDPDNDNDGIPDGIDKCPNEPETINGVQDDDGCPDKGDSLVVLSPERLELLDAITFDRDFKPSKKSTNLLGQIAATLRAHGEIARLRITVYVQPTKNSDKDQEVSDKRANAVRDWLVQWGIDGKRLVARGFGGTKPLVSPDQKGAADLNNRVELIILERH